MKNVHLDWSRAKVDAMNRARKPVSGVVAVLVSDTLGDEYGTLATGKSAESIAATIPPSVGIYAVMPSSDPEEVASHVLSLWDMEETSAAPYTVKSDGVSFHKADPDHLLSDIRISAWDNLAEQHPVEIVELWGTAARKRSTQEIEKTIIYRCTDNGSDATAHEEDGFFVVRAGSRFGVVRNGNDSMMQVFRRAIARDFSFDETSLTLNEDVKLLYADEAARIVTGCLCDERSWIAPDGSHPTVRKDARM